jgi:hypothetical protein
MLVHVRNGCVSDPVGVVLYEEEPLKPGAKDGDGRWYGLPKLRCLRGSSHVESTFSQSNSLVVGPNTGVALGHGLLLTFAFKHNLKMRARRLGLPEPVHTHLWLECMTNTLLVRFGLPPIVLCGSNTRPPAATESFGMAHLRRRLGAVDEAAAALAEGADPVDEENRQVELQRLRLRLFGGSVDACLAPSWASAQPAAAASAAAASSAQLGAPQVDAHASPPQPPLLPPLPSSALASVFATPPQQLAATAQPALASSLALQDTRALPPPLLSSPLLPVPVLAASQKAMPLASTALTSSVLAHAAADAASLFASGASGALLDAPALHAEPAGGGGPRWQRGSLRPSDYATPIETQEERILFTRVLGSKAAPRDTDGWHRFAEDYNAAVAAETERLPRR